MIRKMAYLPVIDSGRPLSIVGKIERARAEASRRNEGPSREVGSRSLSKKKKST